MTAALDIKRESVQLVDSVVAEDIGKFPDNNLIEALQRLPGVQVTNRGSGEVSGVQIRGLSDINTTLNGENIFTASGQSVALQDIPASLLSRVDVFKTRSADLIERGIAGSMNIRTHRPLDFTGNKFVLATRAIYQEQGEDWGHNTSALFSTRWDTSMGKVGALLNLSFVRTPYRDQNVTAGAMVPFVNATPPATGAVNWVPYERIFPTRAGVTENPIWQAGLEAGLPTAPGSTLRINGVQVPYVLARDAVFQNDFTGTRDRPSGNLSLQWAPNKDSEYTFETFYLGYENDSFNNLFFSFVDWWGGPHGNVTLYPGTNIVQSRARTPNVYGFTSGDLTHGETDNWFYSLSGKWNISDALKLRSALTYQESEFATQFFAMRAERVHPAISVNFNPGNGVPAFSFEDNTATANINEANMADPRLWTIAQLYDNGNKFKGDAKTWSLDGDYTPTNWGIINAVKFGTRYDVRGASEAARTQDSDGADAAGPGVLGRGLADFPELQHYNEGFFDGRSAVPSAWVVPNGYEIFNNAEKWRQLYKARFPAFKTTNELSLIENFDVEETTTNAYLRGDFKTFIAGHKLDGQVGARYVNVETEMLFRDRSTLQTGTASVKSEKILPSGSVRFAITPSLMLRASYAETLRRPNFNQLNPMINYVRDVTNIGYGTASSGNPNLKPTESKNYDLALEWYFGRSNALYLNLFKREIEGFVVDFRRRVRATVPPDTAPYDYVLSQPDNTSSGELMGYEAGAQYFVDELHPLLKGFGVKASYTSLESEQDIPITNSAGQVTGSLVRDLFGVSKSSYNVTLLYERSRFSANLSYVWREAFLANYEAALFANPLGVNRRPEESLDFSMTYRVSKNLSLTFDATNLTDTLYQSYYGNNSTTNNFGSSLYSRTFAVGARFDF